MFVWYKIAPEWHDHRRSSPFTERRTRPVEVARAGITILPDHRGIDRAADWQEVFNLEERRISALSSRRKSRTKNHSDAKTRFMPPHSATMSDCCRLQDLLLGASPGGEPALSLGILEILSTQELTVTAVYTATAGPGQTPALDVQQIVPRLLSI